MGVPGLNNSSDDTEYSISELLNDMPNNLSGVPPSSPGHLWVFWIDDCQQYERFQILTSTSLVESSSIRVKIISVFKQLAMMVNQIALLQFWAPKVINGESFLTTGDQPFALTKLDKGLCSYRKHCMDYKVKHNNRDPVGRAFQTRLLESTPDVQYYLPQHFPQRDHASSCDVGEYLAIPVFNFPALQCVGILELIFTSKGLLTNYEINRIQTAFQAFGLKCLNFQSYEQICSTYQPHAINEIEELLKIVVQKHQVRFAQVWIPCKHFDPILNGDLNSINGWKEEIMLRTTNTYYSLNEFDFDYDVMSFRKACEISRVKTGKAVVGRAFSSSGSCFCIDISEFNCIEYPLVHYAKKHGFKASFTICLQSNDIRDDNIYILEFFLPSDLINKRKPRIFLEPLVSTIKQSLTNFRLTSVQQAEEKLSVEVIDFCGPNLYEIWYAEIFPTRLGLGDKQRREKMWNLDVPVFERLVEANAKDDKNQTDIFGSLSKFELLEDTSMDIFSETNSHLESSPFMRGVGPTPKYLACGEQAQEMEESEALKNKSKIFQEEEKEIVVNNSQNVSSENTNTTVIGTGKDYGIDRNVLEQHFGMKMADVAHIFGISKSTFKRIVKKHNVKWPPPKRIKDARFVNPLGSIPNVETHITEFDTPYINPQPADINVDFMQHDVTMHNQSTMIIKAIYGEDIIKFQLDQSSSMLDLEEAIADRLKLQVGSFNIKYLDEDDEWILLCCTVDLKDCISTLSSLGRKSIKMLIQPVKK